MIPNPPKAPQMVRDENGVLVNRKEFIAQADVWLEWIERFVPAANSLGKCLHCANHTYHKDVCSTCGAPK